MTKRRHSMRNHKNLRLVIPDAPADLENNSEIDTVVLQQPVRYLGNQEEDKQIDDEKKKADISRLQAGQTKNAPVGSSVSFINLLSTGFEKLLMAVGIISSIISGLALPVSVHIFGNLVGSMVSAEINAASSTTEPNVTKNLIMNAVTEFAIGNCVAGIVLMVFTYVGVMLFNYTALKQGFRLRTMLFRSVLHQDIAWYDASKSGELACRLTEDVMKYEDGVGEKVSMLVHNLAAFIGSLVLAFVSGWKLTLVCLACVPVMALVFACIVRISSIFTRREVEVYAAAGSIAEEVLNGIRTVVAFAGQDKELLRYTDKLHLSYENNVKKGLLSGLGLGLLWLSMYASYAFAYWYGVTLVLEERGLPSNEQTYNPSSIVTVFFSIMTGVMSLATSSPFIEAFGAAKASADKIFTIIHRTPIINSLNNDGQKPTDIVGSIEFKNVSFEYPSRKGVNILKNLSFSVRRGQTVAIVGSSGCGKSTCIQLLQRFYDPVEGQILIDGYDLRDLNVKWLRSCLGTVGQEPVLFDTTVAQNIRFGDAEANIEKIIRAAKKANAHDFTTKLPYKYDTLVGEKGAKLSGGQKQRIAIARALIKRPIVLLLDEATSSLDTRCESKVQAALDKAHHGRTTIIVAHRLTTIKGADKIIVLSEGGVVEEGRHDELMELKGHYYSLVTAQVSCFRKKSAFVSKLDELDEDEESELARRKSKISVGEKKSSERKKKVSLLQIFKLNNKEWHLNAIACLASIISGFGTPLFSVLFGDFLGVLSLKNPNDVRDRSNIYCVYFIITGIVIGVTSFIQVFLFRIAGERLTMRLRGQTFAAMLRQEVGWYDMPVNGTGALCSKLSTEVAAVQGAIGQRIGTIIQSCSTIGLSVGLAMYYEWRLGLLGMAFIPLIMCVTYVQGRLFWKETLDYHTSLEASTKIAVEAVGNIRTVIGLCQEDTFYNSYINTMSPALKLGVRNTHFRGLVFGLARSCGYFAFAACMYYGGYLIENEGLFYADVFKVSQALILGTFTVANAFAFAPNLQKGLVAAEQIIHLLERKSKIQDPKSLTNDNWVSSANVNFEKVNFKFSSRPKTKVLKDFDLHIPNGMMIALIGASGCGKSTVIQLLERFYDPDSGEITISNTNVKSVAQLALRKQLGLVSQEPTLFARSIAENIAYGDNEREVPMDEIIEAAKMANIHNFVSSLPRGYETRLGNRGTQLSGGQKQRIAIARALVRNPKILLLDEATSALDSESEKIVQAALDEARVGRTCILIAHRLSTVKDADIICVIDRGTIAESGTHSELVEKRGLYYELLCLQN